MMPRSVFQRSASVMISMSLMTVGTFVSSCKKDGELSVVDKRVTHPYELAVPPNFPKLMDDPDNPLTVEGVSLGRRLFYDKRLSGNDQLSCASCHQQELAFSDGIALSDIGVSKHKLLRNAPALINLAWMQNGLFWDGGSTNLESQAFGPLTSADEMHQDLYQLEAELKALPEYVQLFDKAFGGHISSANIVKALAQFERTLISASSRYDRYIRKENGGYLNAEELQGLALVNNKCRSCHVGELFTDNGYHNNGLDAAMDDTLHDGLFKGRARVTFDAADLGKYKTPTLRNISLTAPYMHDGRFADIDQVLQHYHGGIRASATLDPLLYQNGGQPGIALSAMDRKAIIAFLNTLTDDTFINNTQTKDPF